jgi:hypothetical protein
VTPAIVKQRLRLASVSPKLHDVYADDGMTLEQLMAFAVTGDHARQDQVWDSVSRSGNDESYIAYLFRTINAVMAAPLATALGLGADGLGLLTSVYFLTFAAAQIPSASSSTDMVHGGSRAHCWWSRRSALRCLRSRTIFGCFWSAGR